MPLHLYAGAMMHDWCEAKGFSKYEKEISKHCDDLDDVADLEMTDIGARPGQAGTASLMS